MNNSLRGKFIVIEGTDGSGKATQSALLLERLKQEGRAAAMADFPRYGQPSAWFAEKYLNGGYGPMDVVGPQRASLFYALDRFDAAGEIRQWLEQGTIVIANRYAGSNMGHQGSKIEEEDERRHFFEWVHELEYGTLGIPRPDMNIFLHVPAEIAYALVSRKGERTYLHGAARDMHEADIAHFRRAEATYEEIIRMFPEEFSRVECAPEGELLPPDAIAARIWEKVQELI